MENKRRHWSHDDAESSNKNEHESEKQEKKKMKITQDDTADCLISKYRKKGAKVVDKIKSRNVGVHANESSTSDDMNWGQKVEGDHVVEEAFSCIKRPKDTKNSNSNSHLPLKIMCSVKEEEMNERETREEIEKEKRREEQAIEKAQVEQMMALLAGERARAEFRGLGKEIYEFLDEEKGLHSRAQPDFKNLLQGKRHSELEVLQSEIASVMRYGLANVVEYWEPVLKRIHMYKAKAFLKEEIYDKILCKNLDAGYDGKKDQAETEEAEGAGSSSTPELVHGEEIEDNFEMNTMDVMEEGDALSGNNGEVILQSQVQWWQNICRSRKPKYFNRAHTEYEGNKCNQTHYHGLLCPGLSMTMNLGLLKKIFLPG